MLATYSLLPIVRMFTESSGIDFVLKDISLSSRILANFSDYLEPHQRVEDTLQELHELTQRPEANIIKLPNISAALPQLKAAISELQSSGYKLPDFPMEPKTSAEEEIAMRYGRVIGSNVNPVLREGNSDRRVTASVKEYARGNPHELLPWNSESKTRVAHMQHGDFFGSEVSTCIDKPCSARIEFVDAKSGTVKVLKADLKLQEKEVIDAAKMDRASLSAFFEEQIEVCRSLGHDVILSLHLKATMMKVSDPIMFGIAVKSYYKSVWEMMIQIMTEFQII